MVKQFSRVLAAVDFSKPSRRAFEHALALSARHGAELVLVHAIPLDQPVGWHSRDRLALAERFGARAAQANVAVEQRVQQGDPAEIVLLHARSLRPDVIVAGTHQRRGIDRLRVRSVAERIATRAPVPVLLVPPGQPTGTTGAFRQVVVAVDFGASSPRAIEQALVLAAGPDQRITLVHAVPGFSAGVPPHLYRFGAVEYQDRLVRDARRRLQLAVPLERRSRAPIHTRVLVGEVTTQLGRVVADLGADLLVVGIPSRGAVSRALFGTTAARLLRMSPVPVLAVPEAATSMLGAERSAVQLAA
jgi:nucleotide-binding universal stress UspA family protein